LFDKNKVELAYMWVWLGAHARYDR